MKPTAKARSGKVLTERQEQVLELRRERTLARLGVLVAEARSSEFTVGRRVRQPAEVQRLQRRVRGVSLRWSPMWTTTAAARARQVHVDHVVPVVVLVERLLLGDELEDVLGQSVLCRVTRDEHRGGTGLEVAFRLKHADLYERMLRCPIANLGELGWERYRSVGLSASRYTE